VIRLAAAHESLLLARHDFRHQANRSNLVLRTIQRCNQMNNKKAQHFELFNNFSQIYCKCWLFYSVKSLFLSLSFYLTFIMIKNLHISARFSCSRQYLVSSDIAVHEKRQLFFILTSFLARSQLRPSNFGCVIVSGHDNHSSSDPSTS
jgi:hypothetical protein